MSENNKIFVIGREFPIEKRGFLTPTQPLRIEEVSSEMFQTQLSHLTGVIADVINKIDTKISQYSLNEVTVKLEISATGQIAILGNGVSGSGTGGVELKFTRNSSSSEVDTG